MSIDSLRQKYSKGLVDDPVHAFRHAFKRQMVSKQQSLIDLTVTAANLGSQVFSDMDILDPLLEKAIRETNPNFDPSWIMGFSENEMMGIINTAKGKYFEYLQKITSENIKTNE